MATPKLAFLASDRPEAEEARARLAARYGDTPREAADVVVALGGDGFMLECLHGDLGRPRPIYGMNCGSVGFLMNDYREDDLLDRIAAGEQAVVHPLRMRTLDDAGATHDVLAFNDVSLLRETRQTAKLRILINGRPRLEELICDGVLVSTPAGSHRLQPLGSRPHHPHRRPDLGRDPDQRLPAAALARSADLASRQGDRRGSGGRQAAGERGGRPRRGA